MPALLRGIYAYHTQSRGWSDIGYNFLVDRFGTVNDAIAEAARRAKLDPAKAKPVYLEKKPSWAAQLARQIGSEEDDAAAPTEWRGPVVSAGGRLVLANREKGLEASLLLPVAAP